MVIVSKHTRYDAHVALMGQARNFVTLFTFPDRNTPVWKPRGIRCDNIKRDPTEA